MRFLFLTLFVACATPETRCPQALPCPACVRDSVCDECVRICGDAGVKRCEVSSGRNCECKGY